MAVPTHLLQDLAFFSLLQARLQDELGEQAATKIFLPNIVVNNGSWRVTADPLPIARAQLVLRSLLTAVNQATEAEWVTTYAFRRFLPTVGEALQITETERNSLGNWVDSLAKTDGSRNALPMHARYSDSRLEECGNVKRLLLSILDCSRSLGDDAVHAQLSGFVPAVSEHRGIVRSCAWGPFSLPSASASSSQPVLPLTIGSRTPARTRSPSSASRPRSASQSSGSSTAPTSSTTPDPNPTQDYGTVRWITPKWRGSAIHLAQPQQEAPGMRLCRSTPLDWGWEEGHGPSAAAATGRPFCTTCLRRAAPGVSAAFRGARHD